MGYSLSRLFCCGAKYIQDDGESEKLIQGKNSNKENTSKKRFCNIGLLKWGNKRVQEKTTSSEQSKHNKVTVNKQLLDQLSPYGYPPPSYNSSCDDQQGEKKIQKGTEHFVSPPSYSQSSPELQALEQEVDQLEKQAKLASDGWMKPTKATSVFHRRRDKLRQHYTQRVEKELLALRKYIESPAPDPEKAASQLMTLLRQQDKWDLPHLNMEQQETAIKLLAKLQTRYPGPWQKQLLPRLKEKEKAKGFASDELTTQFSRLVIRWKISVWCQNTR